jgi:hypothetical protein
MIGTPNSGSPAAVWDISGCPPGSDSDLFLGSAATEVLDRPQSTHFMLSLEIGCRIWRVIRAYYGFG